ncbi:mCG145007, partial [Mus musculus]
RPSCISATYVQGGPGPALYVLRLVVQTLRAPRVQTAWTGGLEETPEGNHHPSHKDFSPDHHRSAKLWTASGNRALEMPDKTKISSSGLHSGIPKCPLANEN